MAAEFLSICIPTRNRCQWLGRALAELEREVSATKTSPETLQIYISDNCSTDDTPKTVKAIQSRLPHLHYACNPVNIGADRNILQCARTGGGQYRWVMGDDDAIRPGSLACLLEILRKHRPALLINSDGRYAPGFKTPALFRSFKDFAEASVQVNPHMLLAHSLITCNIFRAECFDYDLAMSLVDTNYGHMYGMVSRFTEQAGAVFVSERPTILVRDSSLDPVDGTWPADLQKRWQEYLSWLKSNLKLQGLQPEATAQYIRQAVLLQLKAQPLRSFLRYAQSLKRRQTWETIWRLLCRR